MKRKTKVKVREFVFSMEIIWSGFHGLLDGFDFMALACSGGTTLEQ